MEDIVEQTGYVLEKDSEYSQKILEEEEEMTVSVTQKGGRTWQHQVTSSAQQPCSRTGCGQLTSVFVTCAGLFQEVIARDPGLGCDLGPDLDHFSNRTRQVLQFMNPNKINMDLLVELIAYIGAAAAFPSTRFVHGLSPPTLLMRFCTLPEKSPQFAEVDGAVLVFLPGLAHIQHLYDLLCSDKRFRDKNRCRTHTDA